MILKRILVYAMSDWLCMIDSGKKYLVVEFCPEKDIWRQALYEKKNSDNFGLEGITL